ncbi:MAG: hypothetical protein GEU71_09550 [Actinobacteria bacterium]|nr:hypothetical protein [Actinomycetota bacterium]
MGHVRDGTSSLCSVEDLLSDLRDLRSVAQRLRDAILERADEVSRCPTIPLATRTEQSRLILEQTNGLRAQIEELSGAVTPGLLQEMQPSPLQAAKEHHASLLRSRLAAIAGATLASDWNSPSIAHSVMSNAGRECGTITSFLDDYKRDRHRLAADYEEAWLNQYVDARRKDGLRALVTSSGMSAFITIAHLIRAEPSGRPLLVGRATYHECRDLLESGIAGRKVVEVDETNLETVMQAVQQIDPSGLVLDSLGNNSTIAFPDLEGIFRRLASIGFAGVVVVDNTGRSVTAQPWARENREELRLIEFESITKYAQLGFDRTAAGMIVASSVDGAALDELREHLGTNITDMSVTQLPTPDRPVLERRLARIGRNAAAIAMSLQQHVEEWCLPLDIHHPSLPNHPSYAVARERAFHGGSLAIGFHPTIDHHPVRQRLVELCLDEARTAGVPMVHGTSFGFDTTRVYLTSAHADHGIPFVRISAGTEHADQIRSVVKVLQAAVTRAAVGEFAVSRFRGTSTTRSASRREPASVHPR